MSTTTGHRIFSTTVASVYPLYLAKVERKGRTQDELDAVIRWLTGFDEAELELHLAAETTFADFFAAARLNPDAGLITGVICGVRVETIEDPLMQQIRYLDKLVDELAKGGRWRRCSAPDGGSADPRRLIALLASDDGSDYGSRTSIRCRSGAPCPAVVP